MGPLSFRLDAATGMVRAIRFQGHEALRGIYPAVRDEHWGTLAPLVEEPEIEPGSDALRIHLVGRVRSPAVELIWETDLTAQADGMLRYRWRVRARRAFVTNRTGLCVLHAAAVAGATCRVETGDGQTTVGTFPAAIAPHQPFRDIRAITHRVAPGLEATVRLEGEVFEMEDQRNWTDASFKTYSRPLDWPRPYELNAGEAVEHTVTLTWRQIPSSPRATPSARTPPPGSLPISLPRLGFALTGPLPPSLLERARAMRPAHVRVDTTSAELTATLAWARCEAEALDCELELGVRGAMPAVPSRAALPARCTVLLLDDAGNCASTAVVDAWSAAGCATVGTGTRHHFTELNRNPPRSNGAHTLTTFGINAQVHAFDDESLLETLTQHAVVSGQARTLGGGRAVSVGPIVLGPAADSSDPRLLTTFGALWTLGSVVQLARAGVARATYFRAHGPGGFLGEASVSPLERLFLTLAGATRTEQLFVNDAPPGSADALIVHHGARRRLLVAHYGDRPLDVRVRLGGTERPLHLAPRSLVEFELSA